MKKIPTMFERDWNGDRSRVLNVPHPDCGWVFDGEGVATQKLDGTCCAVRDGRLYKRAEYKRTAEMPTDFEPVDHDEETGKTVGWRPVGPGPEDQRPTKAFIALSLPGDRMVLSPRNAPCAPRLKGFGVTGVGQRAAAIC